MRLGEIMRRQVAFVSWEDDVRWLPTECILVETDDPKRGERKENACTPSAALG
eukprot:m.474056 g.474056  ORF g.474056 m.474056 type:complete len:53 (-) comp362120_c0_seq1:5-163(-)